MSAREVAPTGREVSFPEDEIIVSKTDATGRLTYVNDVFLAVSGYAESELLGKPHSIIRHPDMPRCVFKLLWETIASGKEIFAYVANLTKSGDHYWVLAHVTPNFDAAGNIVGYHSSRRKPRQAALDVVAPLYARLRAAERAGDRKSALAESSLLLQRALADAGLGYDEFVFSL
jgi:PAS domain S-box-containing protein